MADFHVKVTHWRSVTLRRLSVSILEEGGRLGLKCLLLSYFRVGDNPATAGTMILQSHKNPRI
jgi:hypothetical protein